MLVLTRKCNQSIRIGSNVVIKLLETTSGHAKIGIDAPIEIPVHREEIYEKIQEENKASLVTKNLKPHMLKQ